MGTTWSVDETAVAIILDMWGVEYKTIAAVLTNKRAWVRGVQEGSVAGIPATIPEYERTKSSVASKLDRMRHTHPELWSEELGQWNREAVCRPWPSRLPSESHSCRTCDDKESRFIPMQ